MISPKIQALFDFIDYLDSKKEEYIEKYLPLCDELMVLDARRSALKPRENYKDKQEYDQVQKEIKEKFQPITENINIPVLNKLRQLEIWSGDDVYTSIWNNNISAISDFKENFDTEDLNDILAYKHKYISFRTQTNSGFLCLGFVFSNMDEILKSLFDFFNDTEENAFEPFQTKTIEVENLHEAAKGIIAAKGKNIRFSIPSSDLFNYQKVGQLQPQPPQQVSHVKNEFIMGDKFQVGDISNNSGGITIGKNITITDSFNKTEAIEKISDLLKLIWLEQNITDQDKQAVATNFDKVKEELSEEVPDTTKITKWLGATKIALKTLVFSHEVKEAAEWVFRMFGV